MTEHRPESAQQLSDHLEKLRCVSLPGIPTVYGLEDREYGVVTEWVFALPGGQAYIVSSDEECNSGVLDTYLDRVVHCWAPLQRAELVRVSA